MPATRKPSLDGLVSILQDGSNGLNVQLAAQASYYGISPAMSFNWGDPRRLFRGFLAPDSEKLSALGYAGEEETSLGLNLFTSALRQGPNQDGFQKGRQFAGVVNAHLNFYVCFRTGMETTDTEKYGDALEDATLACLNRIPINQVTSGAVNWSGDYDCTRDAIALLGDGWSQLIPIQLLFEVNV